MAARLDPFMAEKAKKLKPLWWPVDIAARLREYRSPGFKVTIVEIARTGCRLRTRVRLRQGEAATLRVNAFGPWEAVIAWSGDGGAILDFGEPLHLSVLHHLVKHHHVPVASPPPAPLLRAAGGDLSD